MVRDYTTALYAPAAASFELICAHDYAGARDLARYRDQLNQKWGAVQILESRTPVPTRRQPPLQHLMLSPVRR